MLNLHGSLFALRALVRPGLVVPGFKVDTIACLDFAALKKAGYTGAVLDRDNCLTVPHQDTLVPELAARRLGSMQVDIRAKQRTGREQLGGNERRSVGDPRQAESLSFNLGVPVLRHSRKKPTCGDEILTHFRGLPHPSPSYPVSESRQLAPPPDDRPNLNEPLNPDLVSSARASPPSATPPAPTHPALSPRLLIVGDRLMTDVLLARTLSSSNHLGIWTTRLWSRPDLPLLRSIEQSLLRAVLWSRNQTFRDGVLEQRARGETWLGREGWVWRVRRWVIGVVKRVPVEPEPIPPRTSQLAKFVIPVPPKVALPPPLPSTRMGWAWYYSKIGGRYAAKGIWVALAWSGIQVTRGAKRGWAWAVTRIKEARAGKARGSASTVETES
ncbi:hypothetical protein FRC06_004953 [Ceratobasidium sp. 370]|nr:hypothetical protein FRC06_004953 [Ceratobasidium sp. 370]